MIVINYWPAISKVTGHMPLLKNSFRKALPFSEIPLETKGIHKMDPKAEDRAPSEKLY